MMINLIFDLDFYTLMGWPILHLRDGEVDTLVGYSHSQGTWYFTRTLRWEGDVDTPGTCLEHTYKVGVQRVRVVLGSLWWLETNVSMKNMVDIKNNMENMEDMKSNLSIIKDTLEIKSRVKRTTWKTPRRYLRTTSMAYQSRWGCWGRWPSGTDGSWTLLVRTVFRTSRMSGSTCSGSSRNSSHSPPPRTQGSSSSCSRRPGRWKRYPGEDKD